MPNQLRVNRCAYKRFIFLPINHFLNYLSSNRNTLLVLSITSKNCRNLSLNNWYTSKKHSILVCIKAKSDIDWHNQINNVKLGYIYCWGRNLLSMSSRIRTFCWISFYYFGMLIHSFLLIAWVTFSTGFKILPSRLYTIPLRFTLNALIAISILHSSNAIHCLRSKQLYLSPFVLVILMIQSTTFSFQVRMSLHYLKKVVSLRYSTYSFERSMRMWGIKSQIGLLIQHQNMG